MSESEYLRPARAAAGIAVAALVLAAAPAWAQRYGLGAPLSPAAVAPWDIDVTPDGAGLPAGSGSVAAGRAVYAAQCAACHGVQGEGGIADRLVGGVGTLKSDRPVKTIGSFWPYATTLYDFIRRAMPYTAPQTLSADDVYAVTAFLLHANGIVGADTTLNARTLASVRMPNRDGFVADRRPDAD
jgi:cytochrome c